VFLIVGGIAAYLFIPHECSQVTRTGRPVDLTVVTGPEGGPSPGPGVLPEVVCPRYDERIGLRLGVGAAIALVVALLLGRVDQAG
jgi:hypothetical protein